MLFFPGDGESATAVLQGGGRPLTWFKLPLSAPHLTSLAVLPARHDGISPKETIDDADVEGADPDRCEA
jgi:hypothetical protein